MSRDSNLLLAVWRESCRHIEIQHVTQALFRLLRQHLSLERIVVRRLDVELKSMATLAVAQADAVAHLSDDRQLLSSAELTRVSQWVRSLGLLRRGRRWTGILARVALPDIESDVLALPLASDDGAEGVALLIAHSGHTFDKEQVALAESLREPFALALQTDRRIHEIARLRESAEAEKGSLLRRLGRTDLTDLIVGETSGLCDVMKRVSLVVQSDVPVLILGETGTGKEVIARVLHTRSLRHTGPFIRVNCGAIPTELIDSHLFGHEKGSFTGAADSRAGWFERADRGTLFLDEIGELPLEAQVRLLRVLQDGFVERVGGTNPIHVDVRVVAATHRDLATMVRQRQFREDLWYRIAVFPILLPPLRERRTDIPEMARHFAERAAVRFGLVPVEPSPENIRQLQAYDWPGNIRELAAVIDRAAILGEGHRLEVAKALGGENTEPSPHVARVNPHPTSVATPQVGPVMSLDEAMCEHIRAVLKRTHGRIEGRDGAAALLAINPQTLRSRMRKHGIKWSDFRLEAKS